MDTIESLRTRMGSRKGAPVWVARAGMMVALAGVLTACGGQQSAPATTAPVATTIPATDATAPAEDTTEPAAGATATADMTASPAAMASPVAGMATPIAAGMATPLAGMASPVAGGQATPVGEAVAYTPKICEATNAWLAKPEVAQFLEKPVWNQILEEGQKFAAGEPVDVDQMKADFATLDGAATVMRNVATDDVRHGPVAVATQLIGRSARLAGGLADGTETQAEAQASVVELQGLISAHEADVAAREAACGA